MLKHEYKLSGAEIPEALRGTIITQRKPENAEEMRTLVEGGDERITQLATQQLILNTQRAFKAVAESEEVAKLVAEGKVADAVALIQAESDNYIDSGRKAGQPSEAKKAKATVNKLQAAVAADPKLAEKLAKLGIEL